MAKQVRLIDSRVGDERQPSTRSHRSRRLRRSTDLLREITRHCTPRQRCIYPDYVTPLNRVYARPSSRFCSTLIEPRTNPSLSRFSFFFEAEGKKQKDESILLSLYLESTFLLFLFFFFFRIERRRGFLVPFLPPRRVKTFASIHFSPFVKNLFSNLLFLFRSLSLCLSKSLLSLRIISSSPREEEPSLLVFPSSSLSKIDFNLVGCNFGTIIKHVQHLSGGK